MKDSKKLYILFTVLIVIGLAVRFLPHAPNFAPLGAIALFAAAFYPKKVWAYTIPLITWWISDLYINNFVYQLNESFTWFTWDQFYTTLAIVAIVAFATQLFKKVSVLKILLGSVSASLIFFIISNFGVWAQGLLYPMTFNGLIECYTLALPFYKATFYSDLIFTTIFFGMYYLSSVSFKEKMALA